MESGARLVVRSRDSALCSAVLDSRDEQCRQAFIDKVMINLIPRPFLFTIGLGLYEVAQWQSV